MTKREFLKSTLAGSALFIPEWSRIETLISPYMGLSVEEISREEGFWKEIRKGYKLNKDFVNLENGYYCIIPQNTLNALISHAGEVNYLGSYYMRNNQFENKKKAAAELAEIAGCGQDEIIITRNTTESLDTIISGINWKEGDEAIMAEQDYGSMLNQFKLMAKTKKIVNKVISVPHHPQSDEEIVRMYAEQITDKTRLIMISHMINITGHILPVRKICDMAHQKGVEVLVDGAHAFAHINFSIPDLHCDYYGASLHKWLSTPLGAGILYVRKEKIKNITPLFAPWVDNENDIAKLNHTGTHPVYTDLTISNAIKNYLAIGRDRKEARLRYLQQYWTSQLRPLPNIIINTPAEPEKSCAIANVGVRGKSPGEVAKVLMEKYKIWTVPIDGVGVFGCRITPNVYTSIQELDLFIKAMKEIAK